MAAVGAGLRACEILLDAGEVRARDMRGGVLLAAQREIVQRMAAIDDNHLRIVQTLAQLGRRDDRGEFGGHALD
jgi:hypothetical protein